MSIFYDKIAAFSIALRYINLAGGLHLETVHRVADVGVYQIIGTLSHLVSLSFAIFALPVLTVLSVSSAMLRAFRLPEHIFCKGGADMQPALWKVSVLAPAVSCYF